MRVDDLFTEEVIDEDIRKWAAGAMAAGTLAAMPAMLGHEKPAPKLPSVSVLAQTMWGEARNQGEKGMLAIGYVIKNRADSHHPKMFGHSIDDIALKSKQFSCWNKGDPNREKMKEMRDIDSIIKNKKPPGNMSYEAWLSSFKQSDLFQDYKAWREAFQLASEVLNGSVQDPTKGAVFYHTTGVHPSWAQGMEPVSKVSDHIFYKLAA